jgi:hypothetical protein
MKLIPKKKQSSLYPSIYPNTKVLTSIGHILPLIIDNTFLVY